MVDRYRTIWARIFGSDQSELLDRAVRTFEEKASGRSQFDKDWKYGLLIDDLIAHVHGILTQSLLGMKNTTHEAGLRVAVSLGWLTRDRRIKLGKMAYEHAELARDGNAHHFHHFHPSRGTCFIYMASSASRADRVKYLQFLVGYAQMGIRQPRIPGRRKLRPPVVAAGLMIRSLFVDRSRQTTRNF